MLLTKKEKSQRSETKAAKLFGGRTQLASGALRHAKGDVKTPDFLIEDKVTDKKSYSVTRKVWDKIRKEACAVSRTPLLRVTIAGETVIVCEEHYFLSLTNR